MTFGAAERLSDTPMYLPADGQSLFHKVSFTGAMPRPWVVTLPYTMNNLTAINYLQGVLSSLAWLVVLLAILRLAIRRSVLHWLLVITYFIILTSGQVVAWDQAAQSDSFALTGAALVIGGLICHLGNSDTPIINYTFVTVGTLLCGLIRFPIVILTVLFGVLCITPLSRQRVEALIRIAGTLLIVLVCTYVIQANQRMDFAWGKEFAQRDDVAGRSYQQLAVINGLPQGKERVREVVNTVLGNESCVSRNLDTPMTGGDAMAWWVSLVEVCPNEASLVSQDFTGTYIKLLSGQPLNSLSYLWPSVDEAYRVGRVPPPASILPASVLSVFYGDSAVGQVLPLSILVVFLLLCIYGRLRSSQPIMNLRELTVFFATFGSLAGVLITVALSPSDTARVASVFVVSSLLFSWLLLALRFDRLASDTGQQQTLTD
jgi:hypothetical protein